MQKNAKTSKECHKIQGNARKSKNDTISRKMVENLEKYHKIQKNAKALENLKMS